MAETRTLHLQQAMASLVLDGDEAALEADPGRVARRHGLSGADQRAFREQGEAMLTYRELARMSLIEPLETMFPVLKALLESEERWDPCVQAFLDARLIRSGHYRDIAPTFLSWLASTRWGQERWPFLLELAHAELLEVLVARFPDGDPIEGLHAEPGPGDLVVLEAATQIVSYRHAVHQVTEAAPVPEARPTHLLAFRNGEGEPRLMELTPATAALLVQAQSRSLGEAAAALHIPDLAPVLNLLNDLHRDGAIAGFQPST
ncbi:MAG: putative DNA-binding domain-containing protein [Geothrix sp.]|uniref:HvfC/BufC family peptide modification chaperone n=1 Tax=Geothrix sp. TaxID=1962974 RepID=UPI003BB1F026